MRSWCSIISMIAIMGAACPVVAQTEFKITADSDKLYWTDLPLLQRSNLDGSQGETLLEEIGDLTVFDFDVDQENGKIYWVNGDDDVRRIDLDGTGSIETLVTGLAQARGFAMDVLGGKMYWTDFTAGTLQRSNLDGSNIETLLTGLVGGPSGLELDVENGKVYLGIAPPQGIVRANLDGSDFQVIVSDPNVDPRDIGLDLTNGKVYWADANQQIVGRANLDGSQVETFAPNTIDIRSVAVDPSKGKVYWVDRGNGTIFRANLDGTDVTAIVDNVKDPRSLRLVLAPEPLSPAIAISPVSLSFVDVNLGSSTTDSVKVKNVGTAPLIVSEIAVSGADAGLFTVTPATLTLSGGDSAYVQVMFTPTSVGAKTASLQLTHNAAGSPPQVALTGTGSVPAAISVPESINFGVTAVNTSITDSLIIHNTGGSLLEFSGFSLHEFSEQSEVSSTSFEVVSFISSLQVGERAAIPIKFLPISEGQKVAELTIIHNAAGSPSQVALTGTGTTPTPLISLSTTALSMGTMSPGVVRVDSLKVKNTGTLALSVSAIAVSGADAGLFTVTPPTLNVATGDSAYVRLVFAPTNDGNFSATLTLTHNAAGSPSHVALTGTGTAPVLQVSPAALSMGPVPSDSSAVDSVKVKNTGTLELGVSTIKVEGIDPALFTTTPSSLSLDAGDSAYVKVTFTPTTAGNFSALLIMIHNAGGPLQVALTGTSVVPASKVKLVLKDNFGMRGEQLRVPIFLENNDSVAVNGLQFDVALPDSMLTFVGVVDSLGDQGFSVSAQPNPDRIIVVVFTLSEGILLESTEIGALVYDVKPVLSNLIRGESIPVIQVSPHNTEVVDTLTNQVITHTVTGNYTIGIRGDANHDGNVSIVDVVTTVRVILGKEPPPPPAAGTFRFAWHDGNGDASINILDVIYQINRILGRSVDQPLSKVVYSPVTVDLNQPMASGTALYLPVTIETDTPIGGLQLAYAYDPSLVTVGEPRMAVPSDDVTLQWYAKDGILRVIAYSTSGEAIVLGRSALMIPVTVPEGSTPEITLTEAVLSDPSGREVPVRLGQTRVAVAAAPTSFSLALARPNPFNPSTTIAYEVPEQTQITLTIYNLLGQKVIRLVDQVQAAGRYEAVWHGVNSRGAGVASGIYLYRIVSGSGYVDTKRMTLLK